MSEYPVREYIVRETCYPVAGVKQEVVCEIVRCRNCKYRRSDDFCAGRGYPEQLVPDDGYCDKGKRREVEDGR